MIRHGLMLVIVLLSAAFATSSRARAAAVADAVVKTESFFCADPATKRTGSGTLLSHAGRLYVLTSAHVLFHGDKFAGICHQVLTAGRASIMPARLEAVDTFNGLALLQLTTPSEAATSTAIAVQDLERDAEVLSAAERDRGELERDFGPELTLVGYRFASYHPVTDERGGLLNVRGDLPILPGVPRTLEVDGHSEYGMSGGAAFAQAGDYLGLISHHYLTIRAGRASRVMAHGPGEREGPIVTLVVPLTTIMPWLTRALAGQAAMTVEMLGEQKNGRFSIAFDGLRFTAEQCEPPKADQKAGGEIGGDGIGIGGDGIGIGGDGIGIGGDGIGIGGDGIGIGGDLEKLALGCRFVITEDHTALTPWPFARSLQAITEIKAKLRGAKAIYWVATEQGGRRYGFSTPHMALAQVELRGHVPVLLTDHELAALTVKDDARLIEEDPEVPEHTPCSCRPYDPIPGNLRFRKYDLFYKDRDGNQRLIHSYEDQVECIAALKRTLLCLQSRKPRRRMCVCHYSQRDGRHHLYYEGNDGHPVYSRQSFPFADQCEAALRRHPVCNMNAD